MYPILVQYGDFVLASWHVFFVLGAFAAWFALHSLRDSIVPELSANTLDKLFAGLYIAGYFGARMASVVIEEKPSDLFEFVRALFSFGAMTLYGGVIAVALGILLLAYAKHLSLRRLALFFVGPGLLAIGLGRVGCFLNGDDYGKAVADQLRPPVWALRVPALEDGVFRYPVQIIEAGFCLLFGLIFLILAKRRRSLWIADAGILFYTILRFLLEFIRGDERGRFLASPLSTSQGISLVLLLLWAGYRLWDRRRSTQG